MEYEQVKNRMGLRAVLAHDIDIEVRIGEEDIGTGKASEEGECPVACALNRAAKTLPGVKKPVAHVEQDTMSLFFERGEGGYEVSMTTPEAIATFMERFDGNEEVNPISFRFAGRATVVC